MAQIPYIYPESQSGTRRINFIKEDRELTAARSWVEKPPLQCYNVTDCKQFQTESEKNECLQVENLQTFILVVIYRKLNCALSLCALEHKDIALSLLC